MRLAGYTSALIDASFFRCDFSENLKEELGRLQLYTARTFCAEIQELEKLLFGGHRRSMDDNLEFLTKYKLSVFTLPETENRFNGDAWGIVNYLCSVQESDHWVLISSSELLRQRIVLSHLKLDIFDPIGDRLYTSDEYQGLCAAYEFSIDSTSLPAAAKKADVGTKLFRTEGKPVILGEELQCGGEATLNRVDGIVRQVAKVFHPGKLNGEKYNNITGLSGINEEMGVSWAEFPRDILFYDKKCTIPAGFLENYVHAELPLSDNPLYLGNIVEIFVNGLDRCTIKDTVSLCMKIVRQVVFLNYFGVVVSDFNWENFAIDLAAPDAVQMWDTDSFGYGNYFSGMCSPDLVTSRTYQFNMKDEVIKFCNEALCAFVFSVFSLGDSPLYEGDGSYKYYKPDYEQGFKIKYFPDVLYSYLHDVYTGKREASAEMLLDVLAHAINTSFADTTYRDLLMQSLELTETEIEEAIREYTQANTIRREPEVKEREETNKSTQAERESGTPAIEKARRERERELARKQEAENKKKKKKKHDNNQILFLYFVIFFCLSFLVCLLVFRYRGILAVVARPGRLFGDVPGLANKPVTHYPHYFIR